MMSGFDGLISKARLCWHKLRGDAVSDVRGDSRGALFAGTTLTRSPLDAFIPQVYLVFPRISRQQKESRPSQSNPPRQWRQSRLQGPTWWSREQTKSTGHEAPQGRSW